MLAVINTPDEDKPVALREVEVPSPAPNEALIEVAAFSLNRGELAQLKRLEHGWRPGQDVAGTVVRRASRRLRTGCRRTEGGQNGHRSARIGLPCFPTRSGSRKPRCCRFLD
jgi:NADPH:quinone reductase-like Zn-dependent oxidoreductase